MIILYSFTIRLYAFAIFLAAGFNAKAKLWVKGRRNWKKTLTDIAQNIGSNSTWFHCSSYGEYLQALPLIQALYKKQNERIIVSFFSPSGYENFKKTEAIKAVFYLPIDTLHNANYLIKTLKPKRFVGIKYDVWPNLISVLKKHKVPTALVAAEFRPSQIYFKAWGGFFRNALKKFDVIFCQYPKSKQLLSNIGINAEISGDPRFDQALINVNTDYENAVIQNFIGQEKAIIIGSAWENEIAVIKHIYSALATEKFIVAPHNIETKYVKKLMLDFDGEYTLLSEGKTNDKRILVIDSIGQLRFTYRYAKLAIVGGGFTGKLHNIIEALAYNLPVFIGNKHHKFPEADYAILHNAAIDAPTTAELAEKIINQIKQQKIGELGKNAKECMQNNLGATEILLKHSIFE